MFGFFDTELGRVQISPSIIRGIILREIQKNKYFTTQGARPNEEYNRKTAEKCVRVNFTEGHVDITLLLSVLYGSRIIKEARVLQGKIAKTLHLKAGIYADKISINVESVFEEALAEQPLLIEQDHIFVDQPQVDDNVVNQ